MCLLTMAEILRRAAEETFQTKLREEDELGFGFPPIDLKEMLYGAKRILDADREVKNQFLRQFGLDYGVRLRWYVEGYTEYYAIAGILGRYTAVELVNLRGQVAAKGGRGVAFRDNLCSDVKSQVFSLVSIDNDRSDFLYAVRRAAEDDQICGEFYLSKPDFEFENFTLDELEEILWRMALDIDPTIDNRASLHDAIAGVQSAKQLFKAIKEVLPEVSKGKEWGEKLLAFAWEHPAKVDESTGESKKRLLVEAIEIAIRSVSADYLSTRRELKVDPATGRLVERNQDDPTVS